MKQLFTGPALIAAVYLLSATGFLIIHFTRVEYFSATVGNIAIQGTSGKGTALAPPKMKQLTLSWEVFELNLRAGDKAALVTEEGISHALEILDWQEVENAVRVNLSDGAGFILSSPEEKNEFRLEPVIPETIPPVQALVLPLRSNNTQITPSPHNPKVLIISEENSSYTALLPDNSSWDTKKGRLVLAVGNNPVFAISDNLQSRFISALEWYQQETIPSKNDYQKSLNGWIGKTRDGWRIRYDADKGLWLNNMNGVVWSDLLAASLLSDAVKNGRLSASLPNINTAVQKSSASPGWLLSPYLGNIITASSVHSREIQNTVIKLNAKQANPGFDIPNALLYLLDSGNSAAARNFAAVAADIPDVPLSVIGTIHRIAVLNEAAKLGVSILDSGLINRMVQDFLITRINWFHEGLWLLQEDDTVDIKMSILAGQLILDQGNTAKKNDYQAIGRQLIMSALALSRANGMLPQNLSPYAGTEITQSGLITPEEIFPLVVENSAYPRHISLARELKPGAWAITGAELFILRSTEQETVLTVDFPQGGTHYIAIKGVKPIYTFTMNGIHWYKDPKFQRYYAGWYDDPAAEIVYFKIYHQSRREIVRFSHIAPESVPDTAIEAQL